MRAAVPGVRVVIVSGFDRRAMESQVVEAGADAYLQKGLPPDDVVASLRVLFPESEEAVQLEPVPVPEPRESPAKESPERARIRALEADLEELLYVVSHDLNEPVHVAKGFAERLARRVRTDEEGEFCEFIVDAANRMQQLLDDLLEYARAGRGELPRELLDCRRLVDGVVGGHVTALSRTGGRVVVGELPRTVVTSRLVLTQVLHNLVGNAVKFTRPGVPPVVHLEAGLDGSAVVFQVRDNGVGIDPEQTERVFQPFTRLHPREAYPGSGVGLAICRRLVERCGGRIWVEPGEGGSAFFVELPA
jgi:signal transduction histidine kinase